LIGWKRELPKDVFWFSTMTCLLAFTVFAYATAPGSGVRQPLALSGGIA
jgi:hypothetical protein